MYYKKVLHTEETGPSSGEKNLYYTVNVTAPDN